MVLAGAGTVTVTGGGGCGEAAVVRVGADAAWVGDGRFASCEPTKKIAAIRPRPNRAATRVVGLRKLFRGDPSGPGGTVGGNAGCSTSGGGVGARSVGADPGAAIVLSPCVPTGMVNSKSS